MHIEVTQDTFYTLFEDEPVKVEKEETHEKHHYNNKELNQRGVKIWNFASSKGHQYYLTDINA